ncbi:hypothetical protein O9929_05115 [Vibrio lentus]|nr:hypothetical protein [Vibrio lentus]
MFLTDYSTKRQGAGRNFRNKEQVDGYLSGIASKLQKPHGRQIPSKGA